MPVYIHNVMVKEILLFLFIQGCGKLLRVISNKKDTKALSVFIGIYT